MEEDCQLYKKTKLSEDDEFNPEKVLIFTFTPSLVF